MAKRKRALVIVNPRAGKGNSGSLPERLQRAIDEDSGWTAEIRQTEGAGDAKRWAASAARSFDRILAVGGDGTVAEAAEGVLEAGSDLPLGVIAQGTANVLAEALLLPTDLPEAVTAALTGHPVAFDVGGLPELGRHFLIGVGIGIPGKTVENADRQAKDRFGFAAYLFAFLEGLGEGRSALFDMDVDGENVVASGQSAVIANLGRLEILGFQVASEVTPHDRRLDLVVVDHSEPSLIVDGIARLFGGGSESPSGFVHRRARRITIKTNPPLSVQADGEWIGRTPLVVELAAHRLQLIVGPDYHGETGP
jgi:diacylglycerol kinase family enzyme